MTGRLLVLINKQLKNFLDKFEFIEESRSDAEQLNVRDYRSVDLKKINELILDEDIETIKINAGEKMELVADNVYRNKDFWDFLMIINDKCSLSDMPYDNDIVQAISEEMTSNYFSNPDRPYQGNITDELLSEYKEFIHEKINQENFRKMLVKILNPDKLADLLREFKYQ